MSGIVGMMNLDGSPVDRELLGRMTAFMAFGGPDAQVPWADGPAGFGHALLRTTEESKDGRRRATPSGTAFPGGRGSGPVALSVFSLLVSHLRFLALI